MDRRRLLKSIAAAPFVGALSRVALAATVPPLVRVRPGDPGWPSPDRWDELRRAVDGRLVEVRSPLEACVGSSPAADCAALFKELKNPYFLGDEAGLTQTLGWVGAWTSKPSAYAVAAESAADVAAAVNFARDHNLRLVVKGGGHSYLGASNAPDSLLIWTRHMDDVIVARRLRRRRLLGQRGAGAGRLGRRRRDLAARLPGGDASARPLRPGRRLHDGGRRGPGAGRRVRQLFQDLRHSPPASLLEAEVVTADGEVAHRQCRAQDPDLFWALKGGGGGTFGVVTRLTLATHELPATFGGVLRCHPGPLGRRLPPPDRHASSTSIATSLFNPHWGEQVHCAPDNHLHGRRWCSRA